VDALHGLPSAPWRHLFSAPHHHAFKQCQTSLADSSE
jgi:hypothetical protein